MSLDVVIPVYGPGPHLEAVMHTLAIQVPPIGALVISHSGEGQIEQGRDFIALHSHERLYAGAARNRGIPHTDTAWIAFVDDDMLLSPGWHQAALDAINRGDADCILGPVGFAGNFGGDYWSLCRWFVEFNSVHPGLPRRRVTGGASANMVIRRETLESAGGFPEDWRFCQDTILFRRLAAMGARIAFEPDMMAHHINVPGFRHAVRHVFHLGRHGAKVSGKHPAFAPLAAAGRLFGLCRRSLRQRVNFLLLPLCLPGIAVLLTIWMAGFALKNRPSSY